jgi:hypothetical protein
MKIHVIGTCQAIPLAQCLALMNPSIAVERYVTRGDPAVVVADGDVVFRQRNRRTAWTSHERRDGEILYPRLSFNALHPDVVVLAAPHGPVLPPLGYHSSLVLYGWHRGLSAADTARLFCEPVFERVGFFDCWDAARTVQLDEARRVDFALEALLARWERRGRFMHTPNHPALFVMADIARELMQRAGLRAAVDAPEHFVNDPMLDKAVWPIYPEIASRLGLEGTYAFKPAQPPGSTGYALLLGLDEFIDRSFAAYAHMDHDSLRSPRLEHPAYRDLERLAARARGPSRGAANGDRAPAERPSRDGSPYADLPPSRFWRRAVERVAARDVDPVGTPPFTIDRRVLIATAGSCFAQNMSRVLARHGYNYFVAEPAPERLSRSEAREAGYGVFSARCGNVYTARQLLQLFERAFGTFAPSEPAWLRPDGRYADPFRPQIEPQGFVSVDALLDSRLQHLAAVRAMFEQLDVLIFTLGLTEAWRSAGDGAVFPLAPGVVAGSMDAARYEFVNFTASEVRDDLGAFLTRLAAVNPGAKVVLTVSPQPPIATYEPRHVLVSATYTKAALRAAADEVERAHPQVWYFPGYELVAGAYNRGTYYERDLRTVTPAGVEHVMRLFLAHCAPPEGGARDMDALLLEENRANMDVVCDEEAIAFDGSPAASKHDAARAAWAVEHDVFLGREEPPNAPAGTGVHLHQGTMDALSASSMRARVQAELPRAMRARAIVTAPVTVKNDGDVALVSAAKHPVFLCYRWYDDGERLAEIGESIHTSLPAPLAPGASVTVPMAIAAPRYGGRYRLRVTLLQSEIAWFDDVDRANGLETVVDVEVRGAAATG